MFTVWVTYNNETLPNSIHYFDKVGLNLFPKLNKPSKFCQSGEISPNLVTLLLSVILGVKKFRDWQFLKKIFCLVVCGRDSRSGGCEFEPHPTRTRGMIFGIAIYECRTFVRLSTERKYMLFSSKQCK